MIQTLTTSLFLYRVHRNKQHYLTKHERQRAFWLICFIVTALAIAAFNLIISL